jgi:hypothetical protein
LNLKKPFNVISLGYRGIEKLEEWLWEKVIWILQIAFRWGTCNKKGL